MTNPQHKNPLPGRSNPVPSQNPSRSNGSPDPLNRPIPTEASNPGPSEYDEDFD